jgi:hypothetical protein
MEQKILVSFFVSFFLFEIIDFYWDFYDVIGWRCVRPLPLFSFDPITLTKLSLLTEVRSGCITEQTQLMPWSIYEVNQSKASSDTSGTAIKDVKN